MPVLGATTVALTLLCALAGAALPRAVRSLVCGLLDAALGVVLLLAGILAATGGAGGPWPLRVATVPGADLVLWVGPDAVGGWFLAVVGFSVALSGLFGAGYAHGAAASRAAWVAYPLFTLGMALVVAAADVPLLLVGWELMALASTVLVGCEHATKPEVRAAVAWYAVLTHASFLALLAGGATLMTAAGSTTYEGIAAAVVTGPAADVAVVLLVLGFAAKAGLVPLHVWLPMAHPLAPSHVSAPMSAAMVKMGSYGMFLVVLRLLPHGPRWWGVLLLVLGLVSALYGVLQASVQSDLKRLLAYSTTENTGLIAAALGAGQLAGGAGDRGAQTVAYVAALLLVAGHATFKTTLFLGAGAVIHATGTGDLDELGGLVRTMPWTSLALTVGACGAAALPVTGGFVAEWTLFQAFLHGVVRDDRLTSALLPVGVAAVALAAGLALMAFLKVVGIAVFSAPRTAGAALAREVGPLLRAALVAGAAAVVGVGLAAGPVALAAARAVAPGSAELTAGGALGFTIARDQATLDPAVLTALAVAVLAPVLLATAVLARRTPRRVTELPWGCGGVRTSPRMQYTATSFAEPLGRVFDGTLRPTYDLRVEHLGGQRWFESAVTYRQSVHDLVEVRLYRPLWRAILRLGDAGRALHNGSLRRYLSFAFAALLVVLVVVSL